MILERWLKDPTYGLEAMLTSAAFPVAQGDTIPESIRIVSEASDEDCALDRDPPVVPAVMIISDSDVLEELGQNQPGKTSTEVESAWVAVVYVDRGKTVLLSQREGSYVLRGARMSLRRYNACRDPLFREMNNIRLIDIRAISGHGVAGYVGQTYVTGFVKIRIRYQDLQS